MPVKDSGGQHKHDNKVEGKDIYDPESSFSAAKLQNDISTSQMPAGNGGLGEGTPQVLFSYLASKFNVLLINSCACYLKFDSRKLS